MAVYTIIRVYEVPADNRIQATERMLEALQMHTERTYHINDYIREPGEGTGKNSMHVARLITRLVGSLIWLFPQRKTQPLRELRPFHL